MPAICYEECSLIATAIHRWGLILVIAAYVGCSSSEGPERVAIRGAVTLDGEPLPAGMIRFLPTGATAGPAGVAIIKNGRYQASAEEGPLVGRNRVEIEATDYFRFAIDDEAAFAAAASKRSTKLPRNPVPAKYNRQSTLTVDIAAGQEKDVDFALKTRP
jgi:hypothetical protein